MTMNRTVLLVVDGDREILQGLKEGLSGQAESISVLLAVDGIEALQILKHQPISLVVTDLKVPRMDGFELLAAITRSYPDIPVVLIAGYSTPDMEKLAWQGGAAGFIVKPFRMVQSGGPTPFPVAERTRGRGLAPCFSRHVPAADRNGAEDMHGSFGGQSHRKKRGALFYGGSFMRCAPGGLEWKKSGL